MGLMNAIFGALIPKFVLLVGWYNDQTYWGNLFGSGVWFLGGFLFFPWTTLLYGLMQANGMSFVNWIFLLFGVADRPRDLGDRVLRRPQGVLLLPHLLHPDHQGRGGIPVAAFVRPVARRGRPLLVGVGLGGVDRGGEVGAGHAARLLALRPVQLLVDLLLGVAALEQRLLGGQDHVRVAADVGDRVRRRQAELVEDRRQDRLDPAGPAGPSGVPRVVRRARPLART